MNQDRPTVGHVLHRLSRAGAEVLAGDLARKLADRYRFVFLCLDGIGPLGDELASEGFAVVNLKRRPGLDRSVARRLQGAAVDHGIGLLHAHQYTPFFYAALSRGLGSSPPILFTEHGRHYPDQRKLKRVLANHWLLKPTDRVSAVGRFVARALTENEGITAGRIQVIHNGIDPDAFPPADPASRATARGLIGIDSDAPLVMQVARFHAVKDHQTAVRAFARVVDHASNARLCLIGEGNERQAIEALSAELGIHDHVLFLGARGDVDKLIPAADVFMLSSVSEGVSVTLLEAMSTAVPIAATDVGGNSEVVEHDKTGLLSPRGDDRALADSLVALLADSEERRAMGDAGRARLLDMFTQNRMHSAYADLYGHML
jgi:glycosyltransferase involved in cell wall biosynthesis